jgi:hypothetical protein
VEGAIVYIGGFETFTKTDAIIQLFTSSGFELTTLEVIWIDGQSTFVVVNTTETPESVIAKLRGNVNSTWSLKTYEEYKADSAAATAAVASESPSGSGAELSLFGSVWDWVTRAVSGHGRGHKEDNVEEPGSKRRRVLSTIEDACV